MTAQVSGWFVFVALMLASFRGGAGNQVAWTAHVGEAAIPLPPGLFYGRPLPVAGTRWRCVVDKLLRQDSGGNTFSTLTVRCDDAVTTVSASASCAIGAQDSRQVSFELAERTANVKNAIRAECVDGF